MAPEQPVLTATMETASPQKPEPKSIAAIKWTAGVSKKKPAAIVKTDAAKTTPRNLMVPTQISTSPLEEISDLMEQLPLPVCVELTCRLLTSISSLLPTGSARPQVVVKTIIPFAAEYGSTH